MGADEDTEEPKNLRSVVLFFFFLLIVAVS